MNRATIPFFTPSSASLLARLENSECSFWKDLERSQFEVLSEQDVPGWKIEQQTNGDTYLIVARRKDVGQTKSYYVTVFDLNVKKQKEDSQNTLLDIPNYMLDTYTARDFADAFTTYLAAIKHFNK